MTLPTIADVTAAPLHLSDSVTSCFSLDTRPGLEY
jgi:hypothetical protein